MSSGGGLRPLLPAASSPKLPPDPARRYSLVPRQPHVASACSACRKSKSKCSGDKPRCVRCTSRDLVCEYDTELIGIGLGELRKRHAEVLSQNGALQALLVHMVQQSVTESQHILARLRATGNPEGMMDLVMTGDLIMQKDTPPSTSDGDDAIRELEEAALRDSFIKTPALPWTGVVGDGLVSDLISGFMAHDQPFLFAFIDRDLFLEDMFAGSPTTATYCSPFLVNAICALRSHTSQKAKAYGALKSIDLRHEFLDKAKQHLDQERGRISLPTVQGLAIMYMCCAVMGMDRAGRMFRYTAYDMLKQLRLIRAQRSLVMDPGNDDKIQAARAASRASWGMYCFDRHVHQTRHIVSFAYAQHALVPRPTCPRTFLGASPNQSPIDGLDSSSIFDAMCDLSIMYNQAMKHHSSGKYPVGSESDLARRVQLLTQIQDWTSGLAASLRFSSNPTVETWMLRSFEDQVILSIVQDLDQSTLLPTIDLVVRDVSMACCLRSIEGLHQFVQDANAGFYSSYLIFPMYNAAIHLVNLLDVPTAAELFSQLCHHLSLRSKDFPFTAYLLQGMAMLAARLRMELPPQTRPYFEALDFSPDDLSDVPITFVIPDHEEVKKQLGKRQEETEDQGVQLGALITKE